VIHMTAARSAAQLYAAALRLDGPTLANLELLENSTGESAGSLLSRLDSCACAGGLAHSGYLRMCLESVHACAGFVHDGSTSADLRAKAWVGLEHPVWRLSGGGDPLLVQVGGGCCGGGCAGRSPTCAPSAPVRMLWTCSSRRPSWWAFRAFGIPTP
jgi:hypothetical protein